MHKARPQIIEEIFAPSKQKFIEHLAIPDNHRIIFSGRFGIGKTTFLKHYFSKETQDANIHDSSTVYKHLHLYPVNYQVGENADVFEYLKYDILTRLLIEPSIKIDIERIKPNTALPFLLLNNLDELFSPILHVAETITSAATGIKGVAAAYDKIIKFKNRIKEEYEKVKPSDHDEVVRYLSQHHVTKGSIYERDFYSILIADLIDTWTTPEEEGKGKPKDSKSSDLESVLIIDDLDRIDPHHTFRLFNIFSAHFDQDPEEEQVNKFGFDKIIFVCDIDNIRGLFSHFYGTSVSFSGYIDKFYSKIPFYFNPTQEIIESITKFPSAQFRFQNFGGRKEDDERINQNYQVIVSELRSLFNDLLSYVIQANGVSTRNLVKVKENKISISAKPILRISGKLYGEVHLLIFLIVKLLLNYVGTMQEVIHLLRRCEQLALSNSKLLSDIRDGIIRHSIVYLGIDTQEVNGDNETYHKYRMDDGTTFYFKWNTPIHHDTFVDVNIQKIESLEGTEIPYKQINPFTLLILAVQKISNDTRS